MANGTENCISMLFDDGTWDCCWSAGIIEPAWEHEDVTSGLRKSYTPKARAWRTCQYFLRGMSAVCSNWENQSEEVGQPSYGCTAEGELPSGFNGGHCDFLGRRSWCSRYEPSALDNLDEYICAAPNPYLTGVGKNIDGIVHAVPKSEIGGYNEQDNGVGACDCYGMGRGAAGCVLAGQVSDGSDFNTIEKKLSKLPVICGYYRPYQMSFGGKEYTESGEETLDIRLPLNYDIYNYMAQFQKCQWWDKDYGSLFDMDTGTVVLEDDECFDESGKVQYCICPDGLADDYNTRTLETEGEGEHYMAHGGFMLGNVWAKAGGHVCNGARPDCPCYTGKWNYLTEEKMLPGMPVTANQVFELRFWSYDWRSQEEYNAYFMQKPNKEDQETASIFTFTYWAKRGVTPSDSIMIGKELSMCQPAPLNSKEFIPEKYIEIESPIEYTPIMVETGTAAPHDRKFPSLVREPNYPNIRPFTVVYPYYDDNTVFSDDAICSDLPMGGHRKYHHTMFNDSISVVGATVRGKKVYGINLSHTESGFSAPDLYRSSVNLLHPVIRNNTFKAVVEAVRNSLSNSPEWSSETISDSQQGYFILPPIMLKYGHNDLFICVDFGDGTWEFVTVSVYNEWCGGVLHQISYTHKYGDGATNTQPLSIEPAAEAKVKATKLGGSTGVSMESVYSGVTAGGEPQYSYSIVEKECSVLVEKWCHVGNSSVVFAEIDDIDLNYIFNWEIVSAIMTPKETTDIDGNSSTVRKHAFPIEMEVINTDRNDLIPNVCVLQPKNTEENRVTFMNSEWSLDIEYTWQEFDSTAAGDGEVVSGAGKISGDYKASSVSTTQIDDIIAINNLKTGPVGIIGFFKNTDGRIVSTMATKIYVCIADVRCRNVEIKYKYTGTGTEGKLQPSGMSFATDVSGPILTGESQTHSYAPSCGDHECGGKWECPMWFPFNMCRGYDLYNVFTFCNHCQASIVGPMNDAVVGVLDYSSFYGVGDVVHRLDYRYCGVAKSYARGEINAAGTCRSPCNYYTTKIIDYEFTGYGNIMTRINLFGYDGAPPPFGNDGCELTEKYLSKDYVTHYNNYGTIRSEWMPVVMDHNSFYFSFNAFDGGNEREEYDYAGTSSIDVFRYVDQLSLFTLGEIDEQIWYGDRLRFDELFKIHYEGNCNYPPPVRQPNNVVFYDFKDKDVAWVWQEGWKDVERDIDNINKLDFVSWYGKPKYQFSSYKEEHRLICDEGNHDIRYTGPVVEDGQLTKYPTIALGDGVPRPFEIIYDSYNESQITWKNHVEVGGSSGDENNIYEETTGGNWLHVEDHNTIFDENASEEENDDRAITILTIIGEIKMYYNRGIEINILRSRLVYLPKEEEEISISVGDDSLDIAGEWLSPDASLPTITFLWDDSSVSITTIEDVGSFAIIGFKMSGYYGYLNVGEEENRERRCFIKPGVTLQGIKESGGSVTLLNVPSEYPYFSEGLKSYDIEAEFLVTPKDVVGDPLVGYSIILDGAAGDIIAVDDITLRIATGYKTDMFYENIKVWERKYIPSTFTKGNEQFNLDGPGDHMSYHLDGWKAGVYYPFSNNVEPEFTTGPPVVGGGGEFGGAGATGSWVEDSSSDTSRLSATVKTSNKMRSVYANERRRDNEKLDINMSNLHQVEVEKQKKLYESAYDMDESGDQLIFSSVTPPQISDNVSMMYHNAGGCIFKFDRIIWDNHALVKQFKQWDFWQPGGHSYAWSATPTLQKCMVFGGNHLIHVGILQHHEHTGEHDPVAAEYFNAYYTVRPSAYTAKYSRFIILTGQPPDAGKDLLTQANPYAVGI